jgi:hypothetical protein
MKTLDTEQVPVYLERYARELAEWRKDIHDVRAHEDVPRDLRVHAKDRALFAHIETVLAECDAGRWS